MTPSWHNSQSSVSSHHHVPATNSVENPWCITGWTSHQNAMWFGNLQTSTLLWSPNTIPNSSPPFFAKCYSTTWAETLCWIRGHAGHQISSPELRLADQETKQATRSPDSISSRNTWLIHRPRRQEKQKGNWNQGSEEQYLSNKNKIIST